jgi:hypothetical protein
LDDLDALAAADWAAGGHDTGRPGAFQVAGHDRIIAGVDEHLETFLDQLLRCLQSRDRIRKQRPRITQAFKLDPVSSRIAEVGEQFASDAGMPDRVLRIEAAGGVRQDRKPLQVIRPLQSLGAKFA